MLLSRLKLALDLEGALGVFDGFKLGIVDCDLSVDDLVEDVRHVKFITVDLSVILDHLLEVVRVQIVVEMFLHDLHLMQLRDGIAERWVNLEAHLDELLEISGALFPRTLLKVELGVVVLLFSLVISSSAILPCRGFGPALHILSN